MFFTPTSNICIAVVIALCLTNSHAVAQCVQPEDQGLVGDGIDNTFGIHVDIDDDIAVVGAHGDDELAEDAGAAFVYRRDPRSGVWRQEAKLFASDAEPEDWFGYSVAACGDVIAVGSQREARGEKTFRVYMYQFVDGGWSQRQRIVVPTSGLVAGGAKNQSRPIVIEDDVMAVGDHSVGVGLVYVFRFDPLTQQWEQETQLPQEGKAGELTGFSLALQFPLLTVGAPGNDDNGDTSGSALVYRFVQKTGRWIEETRLLASDGDELAQLGYAVAISGNLVVVGANRDSEMGGHLGAAYVFDRDESTGVWSESAKLLPDRGPIGSFFGTAVAFADDDLLITAPRDATVEGVEGVAYLFRSTGDGEWVNEAKLIASTDRDDLFGDLFGESAAASGEHIIIGAFHPSGADDETGAAYIYALEQLCQMPGDLNNDGLIDGADLILLLGAWGPCDDCRNCAADLNGDCLVNPSDLLILLGNWG